MRKDLQAQIRHTLGWCLYTPTEEECQHLPANEDDEQTISELSALFTKQVRLGEDKVLDELLEWHEYWSNQHEKPFNWYGAVKALKVSKDFKKPFNVLSTTDTTKEDK